MKDVVYCYGLDYCAHFGVLYVDGKLIVSDMRHGVHELLIALGYEGYQELQVDQKWINDLGWDFPNNLKDVKLLGK